MSLRVSVPAQGCGLPSKSRMPELLSHLRTGRVCALARQIKSVPPMRRLGLPWSLAASARLDAEGLMAVAAVLADGLKIGLQSIEVFGIALRRFDVVGKFGDCRLEVVHSFPDRRSRGCLGADFRAIRKQRRHLLGIVGKGRINFLYLGGVERPLALDHCSADLRLLTALFHQGLPLLDELRTALRRRDGFTVIRAGDGGCGCGHAEQNNSESNSQFTKHGAASL